MVGLSTLKLSRRRRITARGGRPPRLFHVSGKSPLGTCHRGGTFYVSRLPHRTAVSSPVRISSAVTRGVYRGNRAPCHGLAVHRLPSRELRSSPSSSALLPRRHYLKATSRGVRTPTGRSPKAVRPETRTRFIAGQSSRRMLQPPSDRAHDGQRLVQNRAWKGCHRVGGTPRPRMVASMTHHRSW